MIPRAGADPRGRELSDAARLPLPLRRRATGRPPPARPTHVRELIEQVLFTNPGERVNRPEFGAGVLQLVFGPASPEAAATAEFMIRGALQQYARPAHPGRRRGREAEEATLRITIVYRLLRTGAPERGRVRRGGRAMIYHCCDDAPPRAGARASAGSDQRHRLPRGARPRGARRASPRQRTLLLRFMKLRPT